MTYHYSRLQRLLWRIGDLLARLLLGLLLLVGVVEAGEACGPGEIPVLERVGVIVTVEGNRIEIEGAPVWGCAERDNKEGV